MIDIDFQEKTKITGFVAKGLRSFQLYFKKSIQSKKFVPFRSDETDEILSFSVLSNEVFLPSGRILTARRIQLREVELNPGAEVNIDALGCCTTCPIVTTTLPITSVTPSLPPSE